MRLIERIWRGTDTVSRAARAALIPFEGAYRVATATRGWLYDRSLLRAEPSRIPVVSVGNISVGGTGKTPFTAWIAGELSRRGAQPAVVLRGYGGDEPLVHARLNPGIPVVIERRRADGIRRAAELGATVAVLDDAFQHRAAARSADIVLLAAEQWSAPLRLLPAGPWREPLTSVRRASVAVITRKIADDSSVARLAAAVRDAAPLVPQAVLRFTLGDLRRASKSSGSDTRPLAAMDGQEVIALAGIVDAGAFFRQLERAGAVVTPFAYPDHHAFSSADIDAVLRSVRSGDAMIVCTLKDAVKLAPIWPATAPALWYVSQALEVESGREALENIVAHAARPH